MGDNLPGTVAADAAAREVVVAAAVAAADRVRALNAVRSQLDADEY